MRAKRGLSAHFARPFCRRFGKPRKLFWRISELSASGAKLPDVRIFPAPGVGSSTRKLFMSNFAGSAFSFLTNPHEEVPLVPLTSPEASPKCRRVEKKCSERLPQDSGHVSGRSSFASETFRISGSHRTRVEKHRSASASRAKNNSARRQPQESVRYHSVRSAFCRRVRSRNDSAGLPPSGGPG